MNILVISEDQALGGFIVRGLQGESYRVESEATVAEGVDCLSRSAFELVIVNAKDAEAALRMLRPHLNNASLLALTALTRVEDRVKLLDLGADDCVLKPFSFAELSARVRVLLRRRQEVVSHWLRCGDLELNRLERTVWRKGKRIELTSKEFGLLEYLLLNSGKTVSRAMILEDVWRLRFDTMTNVVDVYINYLRRKLEEGREERLIQTVRGAGYRLAEVPAGVEVRA